MIGTTLSHFRITAKLGEGGMGEVYLAEDAKLGREVAIKVLPEAVASDPERLARFEREAKVIAFIDHIPEPSQQMTRYWGFYANAARGKRRMKADEGEQASPGPGRQDTDDEFTRTWLSWAKLISSAALR